MKEYKIENMFPGDLDDYLESGKDRAILPIGSVEQHGPHLLLGCDSYITNMLADYTAKFSDAILFPLIPYSWIGGLRVWPGTIDIRSRNMGDYLEEVCLNILDMGFKKLLLINCHGGGRERVFSVVRKVFNKTGIPILGMYPSRVYNQYPELLEIWREYGITDPSAYEASSMMGGLKNEGRDDLLNKVKEFAEEALKEFGEVEVKGEPGSLREVFKMSEVGHDYLEECRHVSPRKNVSAEAGMAFNRGMAKKLAEAMDKLEEYHKQLNL